MKRIARAFTIIGVIFAAFAQFGIAANEVIYLEIDHPINPVTRDYIVRIIEQANDEGASLILIDARSTGGLIDPARDVVEAILESEVPVVVYVREIDTWSPSIGTMMALAADLSAMNYIEEPPPPPPAPEPGPEADSETEGTVEGEPTAELNRESAPADDSTADQETDRDLESEVTTTPSEMTETEVQSDGAAIESGVGIAPQPVLITRLNTPEINLFVAWAKEIAESQGLDAEDVENLEEAIRSADAVYSDEAIEFGVIDIALQENEELIPRLERHPVIGLLRLDLDALPSRDASMTFRESVLNFVSDPNIVYILLLVGIFALFFEFMSGGIGVGLIAGGIALIMAFVGLQALPVNMMGVGLILFGSILMLVDVYYTATNGVLTVGGIIALFIGSFALYDFSGVGNSEIGLAWYNVLLSVSALGGLFVFFVMKGIFVHTRQPAMGINAMIGLKGKAQERIDFEGEGMVFVHGEYWRAIPTEEAIEANEEVEVVAIENGRLFVRKLLERKLSGEAV